MGNKRPILLCSISPYDKGMYVVTNNDASIIVAGTIVDCDPEVGYAGPRLPGSEFSFDNIWTVGLMELKSFASPLGPRGQAD